MLLYARLVLAGSIAPFALLATSPCGAQSATDPPSHGSSQERVSDREPAAPPERLVFGSFRPANWDIYHFAESGGEPRRLTDHPGLDYDPALSPDGRWVVFTSERLGKPDLFVIDLERPEAIAAWIEGMAAISVATRR